MPEREHWEDSIGLTLRDGEKWLRKFVGDAAGRVEILGLGGGERATLQITVGVGLGFSPR